MDLDQFRTRNAPKESGDAFQLENSKRLGVNGSVMAKAATSRPARTATPT